MTTTMTEAIDTGSEMETMLNINSYIRAKIKENSPYLYFTSQLVSIPKYKTDEKVHIHTLMSLVSQRIHSETYISNINTGNLSLVHTWLEYEKD